MQPTHRVVTITSQPQVCQNASCGAAAAFLPLDRYDGRPAWICDRCGLVHSLAAPTKAK